MPTRRKGATAAKPRSRTRAVETGGASAAPPRKPDPLKQAVVVIHGMGEQTPMATLRSLVHALWETDLTHTRNAADKAAVRREVDGRTLNKSWIVPDSRTGTLELSRIATPAGDFGARTDFFEFYWADVMAGTTFDHVKAWMGGLLFRWPHQVPRGMGAAFVILWVLVLLTAATAALGIFGLTSGSEAAPPDQETVALSRTIGLCIVLAGAIAGMVGLQMRLHRARRSSIMSWLVTIAVPAAGAALAWLTIPWTQLFTLPVLSLAASALSGYAIQAFVVPYFGDVARYVRAAPDTVAKRAEVRERGLALLRRLNGTPGPTAGTQRYDFGEEEPYHRIVVVAHSLGSVIAYDILCHFWNEVGPTLANPPGVAALMALQAVDDYLGDCERPADDPRSVRFDRDRYRALQRDAADRLSNEPGGWRITDFVTVGSPLTHAEFLIAVDRDRLDLLVQERQVPTSPPVRETPGDDFLYLSTLAGRAPETVARHDAIFAATRWTNIFDPQGLWRGDIISGPLAKVFGPGILDRCVRMRRPFLVRRRSRVFTHTHYWSLDADGEACDPIGPADEIVPGEQPVGDHVRMLRAAVALDDVRRPDEKSIAV